MFKIFYNETFFFTYFIGYIQIFFIWYSEYNIYWNTGTLVLVSTLSLIISTTDSQHYKAYSGILKYKNNY